MFNICNHTFRNKQSHKRKRVGLSIYLLSFDQRDLLPKRFSKIKMTLPHMAKHISNKKNVLKTKLNKNRQFSELQPCEMWV